MSVTMDCSPLLSKDGRSAVYFHSAAEMTEIDDETVDLTVTSPPYGIGLRYYGEDREAAPGQVEGPVFSMEDYEAYVGRLKTIFKEMARVAAPGGYVAINLAPIHSKSEYFGSSFMFPLIEDVSYFWRHDLGIPQRWKYYWFTRRGVTNAKGESTPMLGSYPMPLEGQVIRMAEEILIFRKPGGRELKWERVLRRRRSKLTKEEWRECAAQVWTFLGARKESTPDGLTHMAPFPQELPERLIRFFSCKGDLVLDPFLGTGTTGRAARHLSRRFVGYEVQPEFRELIATKTRIRHAPVGEQRKIVEAEA